MHDDEETPAEEEEEADYNYHCDVCGMGLDEDDVYSFNDYIYCMDCYHENVGMCERCGDTEYFDNLNYVDDLDEYYCNYCYENHTTICERCECCTSNENINQYERDGVLMWLCDECLQVMRAEDTYEDAQEESEDDEEMQGFEEIEEVEETEVDEWVQEGEGNVPLFRMTERGMVRIR